MKNVLLPFKAPRNRKEPISPNVQASPTRQSPRRQGKSGKQVHVVPFKKGIRIMSYREASEMAEHGEVLRYSTDSGSEGGVDLNDVADSEGPTELVCTRWVVQETQEAEMIQSDNDSGGKTDQDVCDGNGARWTFEARSERSPVAHSSQAPSKMATASPNIMEFENFLENGLAQQQPLESVDALATGTRKKRSKNDEYWEGVLAREKLRLQQSCDNSLTSVSAMMVGPSSDEDNTNTPLKRVTKRRAAEKSRSSLPQPTDKQPINEPDGATSGAYYPYCIMYEFITDFMVMTLCRLQWR
jgi:hypothetical protein